MDDHAPPGKSGRARGPHPLPLFLATVTRVCGGDRARLARVLAGARVYQAAPDPPPRPDRAIVAAAGEVTLRDHGRAGDPIVVVVPSVINPATVLDLAPGNSLLDAMAAAGLRPLRVDWGAIPAADPAHLVERHLLPLIAGLGVPVAIIGYCVGGTLSLAAAQLLGSRVRRLALLATPWHFGAYPTAVQSGLADWWAGARPLATGLGRLPIDLLQPAFWSLDEAGLADKYARLAYTADAAEIEAFVRLEDWSNSGAPLPLPLASALFDDFFAADTPGRGAWRAGGSVIDPAALACPVLDIVATRDRLVPAATRIAAQPGIERRDLAAGHVGMIVGRDAPRQLWAPLAAWLAG
ncbi:hypothetical protein IP88_01275 [alpha proteobacterium AAP81b]|nr:hypothetical protein IP88_01275 [alpha proteobacterium AAP81b]